MRKSCRHYGGNALTPIRDSPIGMVEFPTVGTFQWQHAFSPITTTLLPNAVPDQKSGRVKQEHVMNAVQKFEKTCVLASYHDLESS